MMTSRERLLRTLRREPVDRVPISTYELVGFNPDSFENQCPSYQRLMDKVRSDTDCIYMWDWSPFVDSSLWEIHSEHTRQGSTITHSRLRTPKGDLTKTQRTDPGINTVWTIEHLLKSIEDLERFQSVVPHLYAIDEDKVKAAQENHAIAQERVGDNGIIMTSGADPSGHVPDLFEFGAFMMMCMQHRDEILGLIDELTPFVLEHYRIDAEMGFGDMHRMWGPEYYTPPYLPPDFFRDMVVPSAKQAGAILKDAGIFFRLHSHGKVRQVLDMIVETGAQGLDPIEPLPDGDIPLREVKERYGDDLVLFGNTELKELEHSSAERIDALVKEQMNDAKAGGGYVMLPTAGPINDPLAPQTEANYCAWIDAGLKYGAY
jgi:uroporphyrinogen-III decarboxylase